MPLIINSKHHPGKSIQDIYLEIANDSTNIISKEKGIGMLKFIEMVDSIFPDTKIWALTSIQRLVLQTKDDWQSDWFIIIGCLGNEYYIEYLIPENKKPWPDAYVRGVAIGLEEAKKYLLIAMNECGGWEGNSELKNSSK